MAEIFMLMEKEEQIQKQKLKVLKPDIGPLKSTVLPVTSKNSRSSPLQRSFLYTDFHDR